MCWTTWAVATPGALGGGRLPSRSKWGRYRPETVFSPTRFECSVAGYVLLLSSVWCAAMGNLPAKPNESRFAGIYWYRSILLCGP